MDHPMQKEKATNERTQSWFLLSYTTRKMWVCVIPVWIVVGNDWVMNARDP